MHTSVVTAADAWVLQEEVVYNFQKTQLTQRLPYLRHQCSVASTRPNAAPEIVLLSLWPQATDQQVLQYVVGYRTLYPTAKVVQLYNNHSTNFKSSQVDYETTLNELVGRRTLSRNHTVMLHLFGTSGAAGACKLLRGYRSRTGGLLNVQAVIADTEPSQSITTVLTSAEAVSSALFTILLALWMALQQYIWFQPAGLSAGQIHQDLNNPYLLPKEARKCFVLAQHGLMLTWLKHNPAHARTRDSCSAEFNDEQHERRQYAVRRCSIDQKGRWNGDQERYWSGIEGVWEGR